MVLHPVPVGKKDVISWCRKAISFCHPPPSPDRPPPRISPKSRRDRETLGHRRRPRRASPPPWHLRKAPTGSSTAPSWTTSLSPTSPPDLQEHSTGRRRCSRRCTLRRRPSPPRRFPTPGNCGFPPSRPRSRSSAAGLVVLWFGLYIPFPDLLPLCTYVTTCSVNCDRYNITAVSRRAIVDW